MQKDTSRHKMAEVNSPPISHPRDLGNHSCVQFMGPHFDGQWVLRNPQGRTARVPLNGGIAASSFAAIRSVAVLGEGIALLPNTLCKPELAAKKVVQVLPDWTTDESAVHIVYPPQRYSTAKVREIIPILERMVQELHN